MSDLDPYNHVNNGAQCNYFDMGRSRYFEHVFQSKIDWLTFKYVLVHVDLDFRHPVLFHDPIVCESRVLEVGNSSFKMEQCLKDADTGEVKTLCHAVVVYYDREANKAERIPDADREKMMHADEPRVEDTTHYLPHTSVAQCGDQPTRNYEESINHPGPVPCPDYRQGPNRSRIECLEQCQRL